MKKIINVSVLFLSLLLIVLSSFSKNVNAYLNNNSYADKAVKAILNDYYNDGVYRKDTIINLTESAKAEVTKMFHASCNHLVRTTYYNDEEIWMTNEQGTINSGYETVDGNMMHFRKENGVNVSFKKSNLFKYNTFGVVCQHISFFEDFLSNLLKIFEFWVILLEIEIIYFYGGQLWHRH